MRKLKAEGLRKGIPDMNLDIPNKHYHGLKIEMKATGKTWANVSKDQRVKLAMFNSAGYRAVACAGVMDAIKAILGTPFSSRVAMQFGDTTNNKLKNTKTNFFIVNSP